MPKPNAKQKKLPAKNPSDPMKLARSVVEPAIGEPLTFAKPKKKDRSLVAMLDQPITQLTSETVKRTRWQLARGRAASS